MPVINSDDEEKAQPVSLHSVSTGTFFQLAASVLSKKAVTHLVYPPMELIKNKSTESLSTWNEPDSEHHPGRKV